MMHQKLQRDQKVSIKESLKKVLPCKELESRSAFATVLSFYGSRQQVISLMQRASHSTRAYFINNDGLPGFLVSRRDQIMNFLKQPDIKAEAKEPIKYQMFDFEKIVLKAEKNQAVDLRLQSPSLYIFALKKLGLQQEIEEYMFHCKSFVNDPMNYSLYVHGYWFPSVEEQVAEQGLKTGKKTLKIGSQTFLYKGTLDETGKAFGYGTARGMTKAGEYHGFWQDDKPHGFGKYLTSFQHDYYSVTQTGRFDTQIYMAECKEGLFFSKVTEKTFTIQTQKDTYRNMIIDGSSTLMHDNSLDDPDKAFYKYNAAWKALESPKG